MILGIGSDIIDIRRIERTLDRYGERFVERCFTEVERKKSDRRANRAASYAQRFAAKEACAKALGSGFAYPVTVNEAARWARSVSQRGLQLAPASALLSPPINAPPKGPQNLAQNTPRNAH